MRVNKIDNGYNKSFKGYNSEVNKYGKYVFRINYPHDPNNERLDVTLHSTRENQSGTNMVANDDIIYSGQVPQEGLVIDPEKMGFPAYKLYITKLGETEGRFVLDTGRLTDNGVNYIPPFIANPNSGGQGLQIIIDTFAPTIQYGGFDKEHPYEILPEPQRKTSGRITTNYSNKSGGSLAGIEAKLDELSEYSSKLFLSPVWGGDSISSHGYWGENDNIISPAIGNSDIYRRFSFEAFKRGMMLVDDAANTSFGINGSVLRQIARYNGNTQFRYWIKAHGLDNAPIELCVFSKNNENSRAKVINPEFIFDSNGKKVRNTAYDPNSKTYVQVYDKTQVTEEQIKSDKLIDIYEAKPENELAINSYADTTVPYTLSDVKPEDLTRNCEEYIQFCKDTGKPINFDSKEAAIFLAKTPGVVFSQAAKGLVFWEAQNDIALRNYTISGYDEKELQKTDDPVRKDYERKRIRIANNEITDLMCQTLMHRFQLNTDSIVLGTARNIAKSKTADEIRDIYANKGLPEQALLTDEEINNILSGRYHFASKDAGSKDDITIKALMKLQLDSLAEGVGQNTGDMLMTSYFSKRAITQDSITKTRYESLKDGDEVDTEYYETYTKVNKMFQNQVKQFAFDVIEKVNEASEEKLLDENGNYTTYGRYVIDLVGYDIARYAFFKAIAGDKLAFAQMGPGCIEGLLTYDYEKMKEETSLEDLGIPKVSESVDAAELASAIEKGLNRLSSRDINIVANAIAKNIQGTELSSFELAEAATNKAALWLGKRDDAVKNRVDVDAIRNGDMTVDEGWDKNILLESYINASARKVVPTFYNIAENTDTDQIMRANYGEGTDVYNNDLYNYDGAKYKTTNAAITALLLKSMAIAEANYNYTYSPLMQLYGPSGEDGATRNDRIDELTKRIKDELAENSIDYARQSATFISNQDKSSGNHIHALDIGLLMSNLDVFILDKAGNRVCDHSANRETRISAEKELLQKDSFEDLPLEAKLNIDNMDYFRTVSTPAIAMSKLMRSAINDVITDDKLRIQLNNALLDIVNGNYLSSKDLGEKFGETYRRKGEKIDFQTINGVKELTDIRAALTKVAENCGVYLGDNFEKIIQTANQKDLVLQAAVRGDFDTVEPDYEARDNIKRYHEIFGEEDNDYMTASPYTLSLATLLLLAYKNVLKENADLKTFKQGLKSFVKEYDREFVQSHSKPLPMMETSPMYMEKVGFGNREIHTVIEMMLKQAEYNTGIKIPKEQRDEAMRALFSSTIDGAYQKSLMTWAALAAIPGTPVVPARELSGGTGGERAKNELLQSRGEPLNPYDEESAIHEQVLNMYTRGTDVLKTRLLPGMTPVNQGTPYKVMTSDPEIPGYIYQTANGHYAISLINSKGIDPYNRAKYYESNDEHLDTVNNSNPYVPKQNKADLGWIALPFAIPAGLVFVNALGEAKDKARYIVERTKEGFYRIVNKNGGSISMNGGNTKYGSMFLVEESQYNKDALLRGLRTNARKAARVAFKGRNLNKQYNVTQNLYAKPEKTDLGKHLSILSK